jgi:hypothetical protein
MVYMLSGVLFEQRLISREEYEELMLNHTNTKLMADKLLVCMEHLSADQYLQLAKNLQNTGYAEELRHFGEIMLQAAGVAEGEQEDTSSHRVTQSKKNQKKNNFKELHQRSRSWLGDIGCSWKQPRSKWPRVDQEHGCRLKRKVLPNLPRSSRWTGNSVATVGDTIVASACNGSDLYTFDYGSHEWVSHKSGRGQIWDVFASQNTCYVGAEKRKIFSWDLNSDIWTHITNAPHHLRGGGATACVLDRDEKVYVLGGPDSATAAVYDMKGDKWKSLPNMPFTGPTYSAAMVDDTIYVAGGRGPYEDSGAPRTELAALRVNKRSRSRQPPLMYGRATITAVNDKLIATGGVTEDGHAVSDVHVLDLPSSRWPPFSRMKVPRSEHGICVTENNSVVAVGGNGTASCEILKTFLQTYFSDYRINTSKDFIT